MKQIQNLIKIPIWIICTLYFFSSCNNPRKNYNQSQRSADSIKLSELLLKAYKWHENQCMDFFVITEDSFQIGLDTIKLDSTLNELKKTNYFTVEFLNNFEKLGKKIDFILRNAPVKYLNEINFPFQDADPWTHFQDFGNWEWFKITDLSIGDDTATLKWIINNNYPTYPYMVKFKRENKNWKITYLEGLDMDLY